MWRFLEINSIFLGSRVIMAILFSFETKVFPVKQTICENTDLFPMFVYSDPNTGLFDMEMEIWSCGTMLWHAKVVKDI